LFSLVSLAFLIASQFLQPRAGLTSLWGVLFAVSALCLIRAPRSGFLALSGDELVYRTVLRSRRIPRLEVASVGTGVKPRGLIKVTQPWILLRDDRKLWLTDFSMPASRGVGTQRRIVDGIERWIEERPHVK
jgi:hypothetical protein